MKENATQDQAEYIAHKIGVQSAWAGGSDGWQETHHIYMGGVGAPGPFSGAAVTDKTQPLGIVG